MNTEFTAVQNIIYAEYRASVTCHQLFGLQEPFVCRTCKEDEILSRSKDFRKGMPLCSRIHDSQVVPEVSILLLLSSSEGLEEGEERESVEPSSSVSP